MKKVLCEGTVVEEHLQQSAQVSASAIICIFLEEERTAAGVVTAALPPLCSEVRASSFQQAMGRRGQWEQLQCKPTLRKVQATASKGARAWELPACNRKEFRASMCVVCDALTLSPICQQIPCSASTHSVVIPLHPFGFGSSVLVHLMVLFFPEGVLCRWMVQMDTRWLSRQLFLLKEIQA